MWPYACLSDCKVMVKCVESDGKVIATHVSVQSHCQPVRPDRKGCCHPSCVSCMRHTKVPVGSMHSPCTANGCCSRVSVIHCHRLLPLLSSGVFQFYGTAGPRQGAQANCHGAAQEGHVAAWQHCTPLTLPLGDPLWIDCNTN